LDDTDGKGDSPMTGPNFFLVGAAKAGTTSLYHYLSSHPQVFLSLIKEPNYFAKDIDSNRLRPEFRRDLDAALKRFRKSGSNIQLHIAHIVDWEEYLGLFQKSGGCQAIGECSVSYLPSTVAAENIYSYNSNARIIIMLRNPIWRAFSQYRMDKKLGTIACDFDSAIRHDLDVKSPMWGSNRNYIWNGMYAEQVERYLKRFSRKNVCIIIFKDFKSDRDKELKRVFSFLGVNEKFPVEMDQQFNQAGKPRIPQFNQFLQQNGLKYIFKRIIPHSVFEHLKRFYYTEAEPATLTRKQAEFLCDIYRDNVQRLSGFLDRDLTHWVDPEKIISKNRPTS